MRRIGDKVKIPKLKDVGFFRRKCQEVFTNWDEEYRDPWIPSDTGIRLEEISDRQLKIRTEVAFLTLGQVITRIRTQTKVDNLTCCREQWAAPSNRKADENSTLSWERPIVDPSSSRSLATEDDWVGVVKMTSNEQADSKPLAYMEAIFLSEAQYPGNEKNVDVLGYPLYNIMIISRRHDGVTERAGLGKIHKSA